MADHLRGRDLAAGFYADIVAPLVAVPHAAAFIGWGSDVIGYDTVRSTDHGWGPRLQVFVDAGAVADVRASIDHGLPETYAGWPVRFGWDEVAPRHHVEVTTLGAWLVTHLGFDASSAITTLDWLLTPQQLLLELTAGAVFHDDTGALQRTRTALAWYPDDVWRWLLACQWHRLAQEEPFVGRTAEVGDDLGSRVLAARLARDVMRLCFLQERAYAPYSKWLGSAFARLAAWAAVGPPLTQTLAAERPGREAGLAAAYEAVARRQNDLGLCPPQEPTARPFHGRPFQVIGADRFADALLATVEDRWLRSRPLIGAVDQFADSTDVLSHAARPRLLAQLLTEG